MEDVTQFTIGAEVICGDGICGEVSRVVVDPVARTVTHLVVEPKPRQGPSRLVPLELVDVTGDGIEIRCTRAEFAKLDPAEETQFLAGDSGYGGYGTGEVLFRPYYGLGTFRGLGMGSQPVTYDTVPVGEVAVRRGEHVHATDGDIGRVQGLVIHPGTHEVTHVLLEEGHLWGHRELAIPISAVASVEDGIRLKISKQDVQNLPAVDIEHPNL
ncbi:MAG: PRC-barrel domain-containing protein [Acidimicrobiales bacterium]|jgi:hypothetical protein